MIPTIKSYIFSALAILTVASSLVAGSGNDTANDKISTVSDKKVGAAYKGSELIGLSVVNENAEELGQVADLAIDLHKGKLIHVIVGVGGVLNIGTRYIAVPPSKVRFDSRHKVLFLEITQAELKTAPSFAADQWSEFYQSESERWRESAHFFGTDSSLGADPRAVQKATKIVRMSVKNLQDEKVGSVKDLMIDLSDSKVVAVVISSGGFLGIGNSLSAVPARLLSFNTERDGLQLDVTKEALQSAPHFTESTWPDFSQPSYMENIYQAFHLNVNSTYNEKNTAADNTARNIRDRDSQTVTPMDQSNDSHDIQITQQIRKGVVDTKALSFTAQNVKIITVNGHVTLRGPVLNAEEKRLIGEIAYRVASKGNVENQLEVMEQASSL